MRGLEPPRCHHHRLLRPARLPVPPHPRDNGIYEPDRGVSRQPSKDGHGDRVTRRRGDKIHLTPDVSVSPVHRAVSWRPSVPDDFFLLPMMPMSTMPQIITSDKSAIPEFQPSPADAIAIP